MKVLVTGANGLVGPYLIRELQERDLEVIATGKGPLRLNPVSHKPFYYLDLDLTDGPSLRRSVEETRPDMIIHGAAMTQVDQCELNRNSCQAINVEATSRLLDAARPYCRHFIYLSTDFVFDGARGGYQESDATKAVNWYGQTKIMAEQLVIQSGIPWSIARTCLVYGKNQSPGRSNLLSWVIDQLQKGNRIQVVSDQLRTPTWVADLARGILLMVEKESGGIFHISGKDTLTPYEMAGHIATQWRLNPRLIEQVDKNNFTQTAQRPFKTGFNIEKARQTLGFEPTDFKEALKRIWLGSDDPF